jgi:hypothetical protein
MKDKRSGRLKLALFCFFLACNPNPEYEEVKFNKDFTDLDNYAMFPGGVNGLKEYINNKFQELSYKDNFERIIVTFRVNELGIVDSVHIQSVPNRNQDVSEIRNVFYTMNRWKPAKKNGIPTSINYTLPVQLVVGHER